MKNDDMPHILRTIDRRRFMIAGTTGIVGLSLMSPTLGAEPTPMSGSVGYWLGSERLPALTAWRGEELDDAFMRVIPGRDAPVSDPAFIRQGARVTIWQLGGETALGEIVSVELRAEVETDLNGRSRRLPFHVWSLERAPFRKESAPVEFNATIEIGRPLELVLSLDPPRRTRGVRTSESASHEIRFLLGLEDGPDARVNRGIYFLGFGVEPIDWSRLAFRRLSTEGERELVAQTIAGLKSVRFPYFVLGVDHGSFDAVDS